jgi:undecaprenyl diphosphate synthase
MGTRQQKPPQHIAIIMDGNGRWAAERGLPRLKGHEEGAQSAAAAVRSCRKHGIRYLTLFAFSVENWVRPRSEIQGLMRLLLRFVKEREKELHENGIRLRTIGSVEDFPARVRKEIERVVEATQSYDEGHLILALSYGGRTEIVQAARRIAKKVKDGVLRPQDIDEKVVAAHLYAPDVPDPDLLIRTSGEMRVSNFLLWQISYAELYVTKLMWPDFRENEFDAALRSYAARHRRFGNVT